MGVMERLKLRRDKFHRDARGIAARRRYRADLRSGTEEPVAWARCNAVLNTVRVGLDKAEWGVTDINVE